VKTKVLACPACDFQHVMVERFEHHVYQHHPDVPGDWTAYVERVHSFRDLYECRSHRCGFTTTTEIALADHRYNEHGVIHEPIGGQAVTVSLPFHPVPRLPLSIHEMQRLLRLNFVGRNDGEKHLYFGADLRPGEGWYYVRRAGFRRGPPSTTTR
jgi:hypothetical protein